MNGNPKPTAQQRMRRGRRPVAAIGAVVLGGSALAAGLALPGSAAVAAPSACTPGSTRFKPNLDNGDVRLQLRHVNPSTSNPTFGGQGPYVTARVERAIRKVGNVESVRVEVTVTSRQTGNDLTTYSASAAPILVSAPPGCKINRVELQSQLGGFDSVSFLKGVNPINVPDPFELKSGDARIDPVPPATDDDRTIVQRYRFEKNSTKAVIFLRGFLVRYNQP